MMKTEYDSRQSKELNELVDLSRPELRTIYSNKRPEAISLAYILGFCGGRSLSTRSVVVHIIQSVIDTLF